MVAALNLLVSGSGRSGSWAVRGAQLGAAIGATVHPMAQNVGGFDAAILVKRPPADLVARLHASGTPIIYDIVDAWPQPVGNEWGVGTCKAWLAERLSFIKPMGIVAATAAMARDCEWFGVPTLALPHHARPLIETNPIRDRVTKVGYEGGEQYLGGWRALIEAECTRRGWTFHMNPQRLADVDIVVAMRAQTGYAARQWKSNVKLANAQASGTPCVLSREAGYLETASGGECWADTGDELVKAFDRLRSVDTRKTKAYALRARAPSLQSVAEKYLAWLGSKFSGH